MFKKFEIILRVVKCNCDNLDSIDNSVSKLPSVQSVEQLFFTARYFFRLNTRYNILLEVLVSSDLKP